ncbi:FG-GAP-like repeat-containing protein [Haloferula sp. BvORR071]|uniref:FG-GAP repeat domain-containing protein n=1 Tax=Haloferula sp. BvORR071 TaxID=1396141 RepID=UPI000557EA3B|nr:FG-GAP-like repeat-containing protein [Haloferula sp. BvORR071]
MRSLFFLLLATPLHALPEAPPAKFRAQTLDDKLGIGYGLSIADIDGDGKQDIVLVDAKETVWYKNPEWTKQRMTGSLTKQDHVCVAACDIDHDKKAEVAIGAEWNPGDTKNSGAVFTLTAPEDRTKEWSAQQQHREPTVHRMHWIKQAAGDYFLAVLPLHGCNNVNSEGDGIRFLGYQPQKDAGKEWPTFLINDQFHLAHNFDPIPWPGTAGDSMLVACKEGVHLLRKSGDAWQATRMTEKGAGEVRLGKLPNGKRMIATIEPFHGNEVAINPEAESGLWSAKRVLLDGSLAEGHALATADFLGLGYDQLIAGWRKQDKDKKVGIRMYVPTAEDGATWKLHSTVDDNTMACEDFKVADLNGDGKPDIIAAGRATKNLVVYWNERN